MWWYTDQVRLRSERQAINQLDSEWFQNPNWFFDKKDRLTLAFNIVIARGCFPLLLIYHNTFPVSPPSVRPADGETRLSYHQYGSGGDLCLHIRNDNWMPDILGADMIKSARCLLEMETPSERGGTVYAPSAHDVPEVLALASKAHRFYIDSLAYSVLIKNDIDGQLIEVGINISGSQTSVAYLLAIGREEGNVKLTQTPKTLKEFCIVVKGIVCVVDVSTSELQKIEKLSTLRDLLGARLMLRDDLDWVVLLKDSEGKFLFFYHRSNDNNLSIYTVVIAPSEEFRSGISSSCIQDKTVGIIGLGSLGSKIAISLARTGVRAFCLVDGDILHVGNIERHDGDWRDVGRHKVDLTAHRLRFIHCDIRISVWRNAIGAQISSQRAASVNQSLASCDLLIDATANPDVFNHVANLCIRHNQTLVWGSVYAGGVGGEIARARFGKDPSPYDIRNAVDRYYTTCSEAPPVSAGYGYDGSVGQSTPMQASDADVSTFAAYLTGLVIDALVESEPSEYEAHAYLVGLRRGWMFSGPLDIHPIITEAPIRNSFLTKENCTLELDFIRSLLQ